MNNCKKAVKVCISKEVIVDDCLDVLSRKVEYLQIGSLKRLILKYFWILDIIYLLL